MQAVAAVRFITPVLLGLAAQAVAEMALLVKTTQEQVELPTQAVVAAAAAAVT
jgi:hypothetical protein